MLLTFISTPWVNNSCIGPDGRRVTDSSMPAFLLIGAEWSTAPEILKFYQFLQHYGINARLCDFYEISRDTGQFHDWLNIKIWRDCLSVFRGGPGLWGLKLTGAVSSGCLYAAVGATADVKVENAVKFGSFAPLPSQRRRNKPIQMKFMARKRGSWSSTSACLQCWFSYDFLVIV